MEKQCKSQFVERKNEFTEITSPLPHFPTATAKGCAK